jgi:prepilin-type processing-associated H-X9-DG protein
VTAPSEITVFAGNRNYNIWGIDGDSYVWPNAVSDNGNSRLTFPHNTQTNVLWGDGHVTAVKDPVALLRTLPIHTPRLSSQTGRISFCANDSCQIMTLVV